MRDQFVIATDRQHVQQQLHRIDFRNLVGGDRHLQANVGRLVTPHRFDLLAQFRVLSAEVSGGSDSTALLLLLAECRKIRPFRLVAASVNHGLREEAARETALIRETAERLGIRFLSLEIPAEEARSAAGRGSLQEWARERRYALLTEAAIATGCNFIATGHTRDDQAETVLLRMLRGAGVDGISGIPKRRPLGGEIHVIRPVLGLGRESLRALLRESGIGFSDDPSNRDGRFLRVQVREELLPRMEAMAPGVAARLAALAADAGALVAFFEDVMLPSDTLFQPLRLASGIRVPHRVFQSLPRPLWTRVIRRALARVQGDLRRIERVHLEPLEHHIGNRGSTGRLPFPDGPAVYVDRGSLLLFPRALPSPPAGSGRPVPEGAGVWKARFAALGAAAELRLRDGGASELEIRCRRPGDRLFGSSKRFKEVLIAGRVPRPYRNFVPLLVEGEWVISCPGLMPSRKPGLHVQWLLEDNAPFLDVDFL